MKTLTRVYIMNDEAEKVFGPGPWQLLHAVEQEGSLRAAAQRMEMAYTKALRILKRAEDAFGEKLTTRSIGGSNGGGSRLPPFAIDLLDRYERYRSACAQANHKLFEEIFPEYKHEEA